MHALLRLLYINENEQMTAPHYNMGESHKDNVDPKQPDANDSTFKREANL